MVREYREIEERIENLESRENELEAVEAELEELSTQSSDEYMSEKLDFLTENIETTKSELESYSKLMETTITESNRLRQLALLILDDLDNRNGLVDSTGMNCTISKFVQPICINYVYIINSNQSPNDFENYRFWH